ncbi:hypothetical protein BH24DEI2_BH24DEI2_22580 [soil metagenome]
MDCPGVKDHTVKVAIKQLDDGRYLAESRVPKASALGETFEDALLNLQEEVTLQREHPYPGGFGGDFTAEALFVSFEVEDEETRPGIG